MVQMQNMASAAELIFSSGQSSGKPPKTSAESGSSFMDILNDTQTNTSEQKPVSETKKDTEDVKNDTTKVNGSSSEKTENSKETADKVTDSENSDPKKDNVSVEAGSEEAKTVMAQELLSIMNAASQKVQNGEEVQSTVISQNVVNPSEKTTEMHLDLSDNQASADGEASQNQTKADTGQQNFFKQTQTEEQPKPVVSEEAPKDEDGNQSVFRTGQQTQTENKDSGVQNLKTQHTEAAQEKTADSPVNANTAKKADNTAADDADAMMPTDKPTQAQQQTEVTIVKVSDGAKASQQQVASQVADTISAKISEGSQEFILKLNPEQLGSIEIKIVFENGKAQVFMNCSEAATQKTMLMNADMIKQIIESNMNQPTSVVVENASDKMGNYEDQRKEDQNHQEEQHNDQNAESEAETMSFIQQLRLGLTTE